MEIIELQAQPRQGSGKKAVRQCRKQGLLPGILYGMGDKATAVAVAPKELDRALHTHAGSNVIIRLLIEGATDEPKNVVVKELQVDAIKGVMRHVDFCHISLDERIRTTIPIRVVGEAPGVKKGGILDHHLWDLEIESLPLDIPDGIEVDVSELDIGDSLSVSQLKVPDGISIITDWDSAVVGVAAPRVEEEPEVAAEVAVGEGAAEPEVIGADAEKTGKAEGKEES